MKASTKYHHLNNIKADLRDKKMTPLVIHHKLILRYTELRDRKKGEENCLYPALVYHFNMTVHDSLFLYCESLGLIPESRLCGNQGHHFLIPYHTPRERSAVQQVILTQYVCKIASQRRLVPYAADKA